jgi:hypothetical protein
MIPRYYRFGNGGPILLLKGRLELFFEGRGHGQAFNDHVVQGGPGDRVEGHSRLLGFGDELRILERTKL